MDEAKIEIKIPSDSQKYCSRRCKYRSEHVERHLRDYDWLVNEMWKTQSYASPKKRKVKTEILKKWMQIPGVKACGIKATGIAFVTYLRTETDIPNLRQNLGLLETDFVMLEGVDSFNVELE